MSEHPSTTIIHPDVELAGTVTVDDFVVLGRPARPGQPPKPTRIGGGSVFRSGTVVYEGNTIGEGFQTGHNALIRQDNVIGDRCSLGSGSVIEFEARLGNGVRIHSQAFVPEHTILEDDCWIGPNVVLTNAPYPRGDRVKETLQGVRIGKRAKIGANATILPGVTVGDDALVGAGSVVTKDVPPRAVVAGNPARVIKTIDELQVRDGSGPAYS